MGPVYGNSTSRISSMTLLPYLPRTGYGSPIWIVGLVRLGVVLTYGLTTLRLRQLGLGLGISDDTFAVVR